MKPKNYRKNIEFVCSDCNKPLKEYRDGLCELCFRWHAG